MIERRHGIDRLSQQRVVRLAVAFVFVKQTKGFDERSEEPLSIARKSKIQQRCVAVEFQQLRIREHNSDRYSHGRHRETVFLFDRLDGGRVRTLDGVKFAQQLRRVLELAGGIEHLAARHEPDWDGAAFGSKLFQRLFGKPNRQLDLTFVHRRSGVVIKNFCRHRDSPCRRAARSEASNDLKPSLIARALIFAMARA